MKNTSVALYALVMAVAGCSGNSLNNVTVATSTGSTTTTAVVVPTTLASNLTSAQVVEGIDGAADTLLVKISALDTTPIEATWARNTALEASNPGYRAFYVQEDALDQFFVALAAISADESVAAVVAGNGGQFNESNGGAYYSRTGGYTPPDATVIGPGTGQVSYKGKYAGLLNGGGGRDEALVIDPARDTAESEIPYQPAQVTGDVFMNANFATNKTVGIVKNRSAEILGTSTSLEDLVLTQSAIATNGTFNGVTQRPSDIDPDKTANPTSPKWLAV
ncbi:hypothetical protein ACEN2J_11005 [Pseudorhodobacter sp. W20_MBD10_FR17]|uniref:hypothetical protein n=1 Tax=Pseudorhodobacter sp. W20_MBD10_FR17 TaxID=3240266 RepID=UPI003F97BFD3